MEVNMGNQCLLHAIRHDTIFLDAKVMMRVKGFINVNLLS